MKKIQTLLETIEPENLGITDAHNHLIRTGGPQVAKDKDFLLDSVENACQELDSFFQSGGRAMVDMMPLSYGRNREMLIEVAEKTQIKIIACTGFVDWALYESSPYWLQDCSIEKIGELLAEEILKGMDAYSYMAPIIKRTRAKAGVIKVATGYQNINDFQYKMLVASAIAHKMTGAPITVHTEIGTMGIELVEILKNEGVEPNRIIISHTFRNPDLGYQRELAETGVYLVQDGPSRVKYYPESMTIETIQRMLGWGHGKQLLLAGDLARRSYWPTWGGGPGFTYILKKFIPRLIKIGVSGKDIENMLVNNAREAFGINRK
ncbi:MAG: Phosphotriesterase homology protein [candidate division WS2 bacterium]|nr:Phosphotriesterase homology protein [Candidatus Psychracetigena formicireducens]